MAFATRGHEDREAFIDYVETLDVPDSWRSSKTSIVLARSNERRGKAVAATNARGNDRRKPSENR